jgi:outer membrane murein-binding lipoprotein Lpp
MRCVPVLLAVLLTACGQQPAEVLAATLAADPVRLKALRAQCATDRQAAGEDACRAAAEAFRRRFFAGHTGPDEYESLTELPPIPPSFDTPTDDMPAPLTSPENTP